MRENGLKQVYKLQCLQWIARYLSMWAHARWAVPCVATSDKAAGEAISDDYRSSHRCPFKPNTTLGRSRRVGLWFLLATHQLCSMR